MSTVPPDSELCDTDELVGLMRAGDLEALDRITRCFADRLLAVGRRYCPEDQAQDAVQDAILSAGENLESFRGDARVDGWLARMVANACHRMHRGRKNDPGLHVSHDDVTVAAPSGNPEEDAFRGEVAEVLGAGLAELPAEDRTVLMLAEGAGWTAPEIAERIGASPGAVRTRLSRIRSRLRDRLGPLREEAL
ncbi:MAG: RNA polymerase sigma factor [Myxococcota bacterium]